MSPYDVTGPHWVDHVGEPNRVCHVEVCVFVYACIPACIFALWQGGQKKHNHMYYLSSTLQFSVRVYDIPGTGLVFELMYHFSVSRSTVFLNFCSHCIDYKTICEIKPTLLHMYSYTSTVLRSFAAYLRLSCRTNILWPSDAIWRQGSRSTLDQVMAWCLCWLIITKVQWCSSEGNFAWDITAISH